MRTPLDIALDYIDRGWNPCPVDYRSKKPNGDNWDKRVITADTAPKYFNSEPQNIGVILGPTSNGLTDVDLDCREAIAVSYYVLPPTKAIFGRPSARNGHRLYYTELGNSSTCATIKYHDPNRGPSDPDRLLLELRIGGQAGHAAMTVFPGSVHKESGELISWEDQCNGEPSDLDGGMLKFGVDLTAAGALLARYWPAQGSHIRHQTGLVIGGFFGRTKQKPQFIRTLVEGVARAAGDEEWKDRGKAAYDAAEAYKRGQNAFGLNGLRGIFGAKTADQIADWIGYQGGDGDTWNDPGKTEEPSSDNDQSVLIEEWDLGEDTGPIPPRGWLMANQFCKQFVSSLLGAGATGKSALRYLQYLSLATGRPLTGQFVFLRSRVLVLSFEDDRDELRRRMRAAMIYHKISHEDVRGWVFCHTPKGLKFAEMQKGTRQAGKLEKALREAIERRKPDLLALDPFIKTHSLEENDNAAMDFVADTMAKLAIEYNIAVDTPHHTKKGAPVAGNADAGRGASSARDAWRLVNTLAVMSEEEAKMFDISEVDRKAYVRLDPAKVNIAPSALKATWFKLIGVRLNNGTEVYPNGDDVQTVEPWSPPDTWANLSIVALNAALTEIDNGLPNGQRYSSASGAKKRAAWCVVQRHCKNKTENQCRQIVNAWVKTGLLYNESYHDPVEHRDVEGLKVDNSKRPS